jgi:succinate dehydrogenase / fumarate reductase cytochrome b subunit
MQHAPRPVFLNLARIRYPVGAVASIGHRISGMVLVVTLPFLVWALQHSLDEQAVAFDPPSGWVRVPAALLGWAAAHHLFAGIRHLLTDVGIGSSLPAARTSAYAALIAAGAVGLALLVP